MILTQRALDAIDNGTVRAHLQIALKCETEMTIRRYIATNKENGPLTTKTAVSEIRRVTGLKESEILEPVLIS